MITKKIRKMFKNNKSRTSTTSNEVRNREINTINSYKSATFFFGKQDWWGRGLL